ncbi:ABC-type dipeptide/oligopeptide/nickel transporter, permease components [Thiohalobacter thiocyanaticus]|uniref:ABC-type dipeptide/oligopeptide/nickel transporter, permease components n=1 Tax=Thiohalobacter thiocyanaticus TaxID=585455 RepID=A0A1Z4VSV9_9GAMM|nr:hypothetical protein [Thiohalobacter thiocyanaticus]BAZ94284.1 ABC-type dipeptide/oligopeptide/nickel transporter, permease components [Thiohalobacter thiocyanaticus]
MCHPSREFKLSSALVMLSVWTILVFASQSVHADDAATPGPDQFAQLAPLDSAGLDALRGRDGDSHISLTSNQDLKATVNGSLIEAGTMTSGSVTIAERALDNFGGIGLFNIVTGSNNAVDAAIGVNFNLQ